MLNAGRRLQARHILVKLVSLMCGELMLANVCERRARLLRRSRCAGTLSQVSAPAALTSSRLLTCPSCCTKPAQSNGRDTEWCVVLQASCGGKGWTPCMLGLHAHTDEEGAGCITLRCLWRGRARPSDPFSASHTAWR